MKILVTGAAGFIGSHMCEALVAKGHDVIGIDSITDYYNVSQKKLNVKEIEKKGIKFFIKDLVTDDLLDLLSNVEVVFHFAAQPGIASTVPFELYERNNTIATYSLLEAAKRIETLKLFVNIASSSVYGLYATGSEESATAPASYYGATKLMAEQLAMSYFYSAKMPVVSFRPFSVYGERERPEKFFPKLIASMLEDREVSLYEESEKHIRSYTYVGDVVTGLVLAIENIDKCIGQIFNLGAEEAVTTGEGIKIVEKILGKQAKINTVPKRSGDQMETKANIKKARITLGYSPKVSLEEGLKKEVEWVKFALKNGIKL